MTKNYHHYKTTSFLGEGTELEGHLEVSGGIRIDGKIKGDLRSGSVVFLGKTAEVKGNIYAEAVISSGRIVGDISKAQQVHITLPGSIKGQIETCELVLEKGVSFDGSCRIIET